MANGFSNGLSRQKKNNQADNQDAATNSQKNSKVIVKGKGLTVNIFFDGTMNNMFNSELRTKNNPTEKDQSSQNFMKDQTSYNNDLSNVALLYMAATQKGGKIENIYISGAGSATETEDNYQLDDGKQGAGLGRGDTGVITRVDKAISDLKILLKKFQPEEAYLNVFGFSRGAFFARHFCYKIRKKDQKIYSFFDGVTGSSEPVIPDSFIHQKDLHIHLVGIFDTVSSEGVNHYNDVEEWGLNIGSRYDIQRIIHLTCQNDYRKHFPLTHINTAIGDGIGFECSFPGAHSDVGGSYMSNYPEPDTNIKSAAYTLHNMPVGYKYISVLNSKDISCGMDGEINWEWFKKMGYYKGDPTSSDPTQWGEFFVFNIPENNYMPSPYPGGVPMYTQQTYVKGVAVRHITRNKTYQFVLANIMKEAAEKIAVIEFKGKQPQKLDNGIAQMKQDEILGKINEYAADFVLNNYKNSGSYQVTLDKLRLNADQQQKLYHDYLHNSLSADDNPIIGPNRGVSGQTTPPQRADIKDNDPTLFATLTGIVRR